MNSVLLLIGALVYFGVCYYFYGGFITRVFGVDPNRPTPAHTNFDKIDYVPTPSSVLFGHHFSSIAGAGPIVGPIIAAHFGWLPALLWILIGCVFVGAVHDFAALFLSVRNQGKSIGFIIEKLMGFVGRQLFLIFCWSCLILVVAIFALLVAKTFVGNPSVATASIIFIVFAVIFGFITNKTRCSLRNASLIFVPLLFISVYVSMLFPLDIKTWFGLTEAQTMSVWMAFLAVYVLLASVVPVGYLLQPRDYLSSYLLYAMLILGVAGIIFYDPEIKMDAFKGFSVDMGAGNVNLFPTLFVVIACGACSGFHSLVASGTTSKQLDNEKNMLKVGYGAMIVEGILGIMSLITVIYLADADFATLSKNPAHAFAHGIGEFISGFGMPKDFAVVFISLSISAFMMTSLDTATRLARFCWQEFFTPSENKLEKEKEQSKFMVSRQEPSMFKKFIANALVASLIVVGLSFLMAQTGSAATVWPIFGASNQLLAALTLLAVTLYLRTKKLNYHITFIPTLLMVTMSIWGLIEIIFQYLGKNSTIVGSAIFLICMAALLVILSLIVLRKHLKEMAKKE
ncbi:MAG: carbon starvation protein A [Succinivibrionaceae bacterium]|nr:carbon starvation protein A [Ruminobacter sp.]MDY5779739.1 carbon starvation protein A [Succinivibrionaceae bacterium]MEE1339965.1 carbon starvation protein A [Succinivibrionaceae bacterium]